MTALFLTPKRFTSAIEDPRHLRNWRMIKIGPSFKNRAIILEGRKRSFLHPLAELEVWDRNHLMICRAAKVLTGKEQEAAE
jgi:hypothetical protein